MVHSKIDAVLPLRRTDHPRFTILDESLRRNFRDLNRCWVVTTDREYAELERLIPSDIYHVIRESELIPEIGFYRRLYWWTRTTALVDRWLNGRIDTTGWYVQQLVKLAVAERIETPFYLTLDADVACLKPVAHPDLIEEGRAVTNVCREDLHPTWYASAERVLGMRRSGLTHGVTPALLSREAVLRLHDYLTTRMSRTARALGAIFPAESRAGRLVRSWRSFLLRATPWTEYTLYYTFLESLDEFDRYHVDRGPNAVYDNRNSVWFERDFDSIALDEFRESPAQFLVVQSNTGIEPEVIRRKFAAFLD